MLALKDDRLLIWAEDGHVQFRESNDAWSPAMHLSIDNIQSIVADGTGFLTLVPLL